MCLVKQSCVSCTQLFATPWTVARQEYRSGLPCPPPEDLPNSGVEPRSPALQADSLPSEPPGKPMNTGTQDSGSQTGDLMPP